MNKPDGAVIRLVPMPNRIDINLSEHSFDFVRKLAALRGVSPVLYVRDIITTHLCENREKVEPLILPAWMNR